MITSSPSATPGDALPRARTTPAPSDPGITGSGLGAMPLRTYTSRRLRAAVRRATTTSPGPGTGSGTVSMRSTSGPPASLRTTAFTGRDLLVGSGGPAYRGAAGSCRATRDQAGGRVASSRGKGSMRSPPRVHASLSSPESMPRGCPAATCAPSPTPGA